MTVQVYFGWWLRSASEARQVFQAHPHLVLNYSARSLLQVVPCPLLLVADKTMAKDAPQAANNLGEDFYKVILQEEPFKSTTVGSILKSYRWAPFVPVAKNSVMLTVLLLLSKYRLRDVPVIEPGNPDIVNFITQSAVVQGLEGCRGGSTALQPGLYLILDFLLCLLICVQSNEFILEAFKIMRDRQIGGLPVVEGPTKTIVGNLSIRDIRYLLLKPEIFSNFRYTHNSCTGFCRVQLQKKTSECRLYVAFYSVFCYVLRGMFSAGFEVFPFVQVMLGRWYLVRPTARLLFAVREFGFE
ncbi:SNF1- protein kinase regulatory subunit gamma-1-like [Lathyrus oleraceus]|uniref:SNF1- protein kinase regulatory subunit gamma-1-like n=1 Tax=Pisum sativum TaxID=3888 RepID=A0A9D4YCA6_PEA|nr:SNF1- protein kinase regulatory subunit gamma-1-like [Pisum sativum]